MDSSLVPVGEDIDIVLTYRGRTFHATGKAVQVDIDFGVRPYYYLEVEEPSFAWTGDRTITIAMTRATLEEGKVPLIAERLRIEEG